MHPGFFVFLVLVSFGLVLMTAASVAALGPMLGVAAALALTALLWCFFAVMWS